MLLERVTVLLSKEWSGGKPFSGAEWHGDHGDGVGTMGLVQEQDGANVRLV